MPAIPLPIFQNKLSKILWKKIYAREYGVQYSEMAILCLSPKTKDHIPKPSVDQIIVPEGNNTAFYIDSTAWVVLVESLNNKYTSHIKTLEEYEKQFLRDGNSYVSFAKEIAEQPLSKLTNKKIKEFYLDYQEKLFRYSIFAWTSFILNNYISEKAKTIIDQYIKKCGKENEAQEIYNALFRPEKLAAVLELQYEVAKLKGKLTNTQLDHLYKKFQWLSCLDIHNRPWTKSEFKKHIDSFGKVTSLKRQSFEKIVKLLQIKTEDLEYLLMAKRFVYIKDARDDFRRQGVFHARALFQELAKRMKVKLEDISYLQQSEIVSFLENKLTITKNIISQRRKGFVLYLGRNFNLVCLHGDDIKKALIVFKLSVEEEKLKEIKGAVASRGMATGKVIIVKGVKDLKRVEDGDILVAVTTHPDYVPAMRKAVAIVTDEGGVTSHAAIVSREFGIPCIVGTKNATTLLKNGDTIEVNALEGRVKLL